MPSLPDGINAASPLDASDDSRLIFTNDTDETLSRALDNMPTDFVTMDFCNMRVEYRQQGRVDDTLILGVRIMNGTQVLAAATSGGDFGVVNNNILNTTDTIGNESFTYVNTSATKADWDAAVVELQQTINRSMGADGCHIEVDWIKLEGSYTGSGLLKVQNETINLVERVPLAANPAVLYQNPSRVGPWVYPSDGSLYVALPDPAENHRLGVWRRADGDNLWSSVGVVTNPISTNTDPVRHIDGEIVGDTLHLCYQIEDDVGDDQRICYATVDLTTNNIDIVELAFTGSFGVGTNTGGAAIGIRSDGTVLIFFRDYNDGDLKLVRRTGVDTWSAAQTIETAGSGSALAGFMLGDDFHIFYNGFSGLSGAWHRVYKSDNTVSGADQISTTAATGNDLAGHAADGDGRLFYAQSVGGTDPATFHAYSSDGQAEDETWSDDVLSNDVDKPSGGSSVGVVAAGNRVFGIWVDSSEGQIHYAEWDGATDQWKTAVDTGIDVTDGSLIHFEAWVDLDGDVHIGGLWGASLSSTVNFFDIEVPGLPDPLTTVFEDDWTGTNGDPWDPTKWDTSVIGTSVLDIQNNEGRMALEANVGRGQAIALHSPIEHSLVKTTIRPSSSGGALTGLIALRGDGQWVTTSGDEEYVFNGYMLEMFLRPEPGFPDGFVSLIRMDDGVRTELDSLLFDFGSNEEEHTAKFEVIDDSPNVTLRAKIWLSTDAEPGTWTITASDTTAAHSSGVLQLSSALDSGIALSTFWDDITLESSTFSVPIVKVQSESLNISEADLKTLATAILKLESESVQLSESDLKGIEVQILKQVSESIQLSESDLKVVEVAPTTGHTGWGIPIGI